MCYLVPVFLVLGAGTTCATITTFWCGSVALCLVLLWYCGSLVLSSLVPWCFDAVVLVWNGFVHCCLFVLCTVQLWCYWLFGAMVLWRTGGFPRFHYRGLYWCQVQTTETSLYRDNHLELLSGTLQVARVTLEVVRVTLEVTVKNRKKVSERHDWERKREDREK